MKKLFIIVAILMIFAVLVILSELKTNINRIENQKSIKTENPTSTPTHTENPTSTPTHTENPVIDKVEEDIISYKETISQQQAVRKAAINIKVAGIAQRGDGR